MKILELEKAYIAGFFDGEGCVSITREFEKHHHSPTYKLVALISQSDRTQLDSIVNWFGFGTIYQGKKRNGKRSYSTYYAHFSGKYAVAFLSELLPYLRSKQREALLALEFIKSTKRPAGSTKTVSPEMNALREWYWMQMKSLKKYSGVNS